MDKSIEFYSKLLERKPSVRTLDRWAQFDMDGQIIALCNQMYDFQQIAGGIDLDQHYSKEYLLRLSKHKTAFGNNVIHNFQVENLNNEFVRISALRIGDVSDILYVNISSPYYFFMLTDPDGNLIEITGNYSAPIRQPTFWEAKATKPKEQQIDMPILKAAIEKEKEAPPALKPAAEPVLKSVAPVIPDVPATPDLPAAPAVPDVKEEPVVPVVKEESVVPVVPIVPDVPAEESRKTTPETKPAADPVIKPAVPVKATEETTETTADEPAVMIPIWEESSLRYTKKNPEKNSRPAIAEKVPEIKPAPRPADKQIFKTFVPVAPAVPVVPVAPAVPVVPVTPSAPVVPVAPDGPAKEPKGKPAESPAEKKGKDAEPTPPPPLWAQPKEDHWGDVR